MISDVQTGFDALGLDELIVRNLRQMGYARARTIQSSTIPVILQGRDLIGLAQAGSGKTAAYGAALAHLLLTQPPPRRKGRPIDPASRLRAIVLCPTRELAQQVADELGRIAQGTVLRTLCAYGKVAISPQVESLARGVDVLIATPGRVRELQDAGALSLAYVRLAVIDEADRMLDMGFLPQVRSILDATAGGSRQTLLFTATMPAEIQELAGQMLREPERIEVGRHTTPVSHVRQHLLPVKDRDKVPLLLHLLEHVIEHQGKRGGGVVVYCRTKRRVGWVGAALSRHDISVGMIHGDRSQAQRQRALDRFAAGEYRVLVATDVAARGLHIPAVSTVVNYDLPLMPEEYVHRIGRAAHGVESESEAGAAESFTFLSDDVDERRRWRAVLDTTGAEVFAEMATGFKPVSEQDIERAAPRPKSNESTAELQPLSRRAQQRQSRGQRRSRKSRPIKKGQKPGRGVIKRDDS